MSFVDFLLIDFFIYFEHVKVDLYIMQFMSNYLTNSELANNVSFFKNCPFTFNIFDATMIMQKRKLKRIVWFSEQVNCRPRLQKIPYVYHSAGSSRDNEKHFYCTTGECKIRKRYACSHYTKERANYFSIPFLE